MDTETTVDSELPEDIILTDDEVVDDEPTTKETQNDTVNEKEIDDAIQKKREILSNLEKAHRAEQEKLKLAREERRKSIARIDNNDETVKVWNDNIDEKVDPVLTTLATQKQELLNEVLEDLLADYDMSQDLVTRVLDTYSSIARNSGLNAKSVKKDLMRAYAAETFGEQTVLKAKAQKAESDSESLRPAKTHSNSSRSGMGSPINIPREEYELLKGSGMSDDKIREHYKSKSK